MCIWLPFFLFWVLLLSKAEIMGGGVFYYYIKGYQRRLFVFPQSCFTLLLFLARTLADCKAECRHLGSHHVYCLSFFPVPDVYHTWPSIALSFRCMYLVCVSFAVRDVS